MLTIEQLIENFDLLGDWEDRYAYLIELGKKLPGLPEADKIEPNRVHGCQARVWLTLQPDPAFPGKFRIQADSDAFIVRGLIAVLLLIYDGRTAAEIRAANPQDHLTRLGLDRQLSPTRKNGLFSMVERIRTLAAPATPSL